MKTRRYMKASLLGGMILGFAQPVARAQEDRPMPPPVAERESPPVRPEAVKAMRIREKIRSLHEAGKHEEAERLAQRVRQAESKQAARPKANRENKVEKAPAPQRDMPPAPGAPPKIMHLKQAAEHLQAAGYEAQARKVRDEIGRVEADARRQMERMQAQGKERRIEEKRRMDIAQDMRAEMNKLRREMEEMRQQLRKMRADMTPKPDRRPPADGRPQTDRPR